MVADEGHPTSVHNLVHATLRIASVAHDIAKAERFVDGRTVAQHRVQRMPIGVDVREDRNFQAGFS
jgi:hypothetical protein